MERVILLVCLVLFPSCGLLSFTPEEQASYDALVAEEARIQAAEPVDQVALADVQRKIAHVEAEAVRRSYGPIWGTVSTLPVVGPYMQLLGPFAGALLLPLTSKRGRKHYGAMVKELLPGAVGASGGRGVNPKGAAVSMARALGLKHSSEASARVA